MTDVEGIIRKVLKSGKYYFGSKRTIKALKKGEAKAVIVAKNCPEDVIFEIKKYNVPVYTYEGTNMELGALCGKPYSIAAMVVTEQIE
ncbi:MAG: 50S ribosomal protein L30e [Archaeoglobales archaeon]|nr:50S ribosomal protein L30e [Archaeoglobales archaeon]